ncbi:UDP-glucose 4-epimerase GalE [Roseibacillus ishigakijimensis]|uniref:UDP-glucose 4-epimerase n=1 Tax=Roseibacillus ishigakijimensis TaxID=454146 RepID=A0A934RLY1_9BACT|nr:UDP-glucose 4-epimerase GalE [Roseibacillus ishigakijimensis]MBK1833258.1 UDP-glucose 4-epimerase GalE [Roseibacillus ishigakijimensis]
MSKLTTLVVGGAGYIGSHTVRLLASQDRDVLVLDNLIYGHRDALVDDSVRFIEGSLDDRDLLDKIFRENKVDVVLHFAAFINVGESVKDPLKYYQNNTAAPLVLLEAMRDHGVKGFVLSSTAAVYGEPEAVPIVEDHSLQPVNPYGWSKLMLEQILADCDTAWGLKSVCLRYFNASGSWGDGLIGEAHDPETHLIPNVLLAIQGKIDTMTVFGTDYDTPDGTCIRDYIHVVDLAKAHAKALDHLKEGGDSLRCNLGTGLGVSVREILDAAQEVTGQEVPVVYGDRRAGDPARLIADPIRAKEILGWEAEHKDAKAMVESAWQWMTGPRNGQFEK